LVEVVSGVRLLVPSLMLPAEQKATYKVYLSGINVKTETFPLADVRRWLCSLGGRGTVP
jgi:hypothetical protein